MTRVRLLLVAAVVGALVWGVAWWSGRGTEEVEPLSRPADAVELKVTAVVDGDTIRAVPQIDHRVWSQGLGTAVRLLEIDAPERDPAECFAAEATTRLGELLPEGSRVWAQLDREPVDQYDRVLAYLWNEDDVFVNVAMVEEGFATAVLFEPNDRYIEEVRQAEAVAKGESRGLWDVCR